ncbi:MAG: ribosome assembly RNA-binding protein YhbY [Myxococcota bacterium]|nr:ribosome assembly RNA-binding protein YhbY [Myxococcota bacterium]
MSLTGKQRRYLRGLGHHLSPTVQLGGRGVTPGLVAKIQEELELHELIKLKVGQDTLAPKEVAPELAEASGAELVQVLGRTVLLYKAREKEPEIRLPQ